MRWVLGVGWYVATACVVFLTDVRDHEVATYLALLGTIGPGILVRRWRFILAAALVPLLSALQPCDPSTECDAGTLGLTVFLPFAAVLLAVGVAFGKSLRFMPPARWGSRLDADGEDAG